MYVRALALVLVSSVGLVVSCSAWHEAVSPRVARFQCQVAAVAPLVDDVLEAEQLVRDIYAGRASLPAVLANLQATEAEVARLIAELELCEASEPAEPPPLSQLQEI